MTTGQENPGPGVEGSWAGAPDGAAALGSRLERCLREQGLAAGLAMLNERTRFRFTGLYRVVPPELINLSLYDRENPALSMTRGVCALNDTFCSIVTERGRPLGVSDSPSDERVRTHPARDSVQSYAGVPVRLPGGRVLGTLCHFDGRPRIVPPRELAVMEQLAPLFVPWLGTAASPSA
jgi:GAF domain-containing protein